MTKFLFASTIACFALTFTAGFADAPDAQLTAATATAPGSATGNEPVRPLTPLPVTPPSPATTMQAFASAVAPCAATVAHCFGIRIFLATEAASPYVSAAWLTAQFAFANQMFAAIDVGFALTSATAFDAPAVIDGKNARDALTKDITASNTIDVFVVGALADLDDSSFPLFGVHWRVSRAPPTQSTKTAKPGQRRRFIVLSSYAWNRTMAHELGHYFGLPHSQYAISIMNKSPRLEPAIETRRFADQELPVMKASLAGFLRKKQLQDLRDR